MSAFTRLPALITADELLRMPNDGRRCELVAGVLRELPFRGMAEGALLADLGLSLGNHVDRHDLGQLYAAGTGFHIASDPDTVLAAGISFVCRERLEGHERSAGYFPGAPDLAVEVVSPALAGSDSEAKAADWLAAGCRMVVVVNLERRAATVYRSRDDIRLLTENDVLNGGDVVPGWQLPLRELFG